MVTALLLDPAIPELLPEVLVYLRLLFARSQTPIRDLPNDPADRLLVPVLLQDGAGWRPPEWLPIARLPRLHRLPESILQARDRVERLATRQLTAMGLL